MTTLEQTGPCSAGADKHDFSLIDFQRLVDDVVKVELTEENFLSYADGSIKKTYRDSRPGF